MTKPWNTWITRHTRNTERHTVRRISTIALLTFIAVCAVDLCTVIGFSIVHPAMPPKIDAIIVLGAKVGTPALTYRTVTGLKYYEAGKADTLVLSGGRGSNEPVAEAHAMKSVIDGEIATSHRPSPHILLETQSTDTFQNLQYSQKLIPKAKSILIVSDGYHLARSVAIAKHLGFTSVYWDAPIPTYYGDIDLAHYYVREAIAILVYGPKLVF